MVIAPPELVEAAAAAAADLSQAKARQAAAVSRRKKRDAESSSLHIFAACSDLKAAMRLRGKVSRSVGISVFRSVFLWVGSNRKSDLS